MRIADLSEGFIDAVEKNEFGVVSTSDDPPKIRQGVDRHVLGTQGGRSLGCLSFDVVTVNENRAQSRDEHVLIQGKRTDGGGGEVYIGVKRPGGGSQDADMIDAISISNEHGIVSKLPIFAPNLTPGAGGGGGGDGQTLRDPNGRTWMAMQGDGNLVVYINLERFNYNTGFPVWSSGTVMLDEAGQPTPQFQKLLDQAGKVFIP